MSVSKSEDILLLDDIIICNANSNPAPDFTWIRISGPGKDMVIGGNKVIMTKEMVGYNSTYLCLAENYIQGTRKQDYHQVSFFVSGRSVLMM